MNLNHELKSALDLKSNGRINEASRAFRRILKHYPREHRVHHQVGLIALENRQYKVAARHFSTAITINPKSSKSWEKLGDTHSSQNRYAEALKAYERAVEHLDVPVVIMCKIGDILRRSGEFERAHDMFRQVLKLSPEHTFATIGLGQIQQSRQDFVGAIRTFAEASSFPMHSHAALSRMKHVLKISAQPWHFPMMSDETRNSAYDAAIRASVGPDDVVLDIGCGSGLLSMMAARAGARKVYACDDNEYIARAAQSIVEANGFAEHINIINKRSTDLRIGTDMAERANVLVCEIFDVSVVGEDALHTIRHAFDHLLTPDARVIPQGINLYAAPAESETLRQQFSVGTTCGFDLSNFNLLAERRCIQTPLVNHRYQTLATPQNTLKWSFDRTLKMRGGAHQDFLIEHGGRLDGFIFWYELDLGHGQIISTAPSDTMTHWKQGFLPNWSGPTRYEKGQTLHSTSQYRRHLLWIDALE